MSLRQAALRIRGYAAAMLRRRSRASADDGPHPSGLAAYHGLRNQILTLDPAVVGLHPHPTDQTDRVWGCVMDTGYSNGTATLVCLRDGTTSLYTSSGFGIIGGGAHPAVVQANAALLAVLADELDRLPPSRDDSLPGVGRTVIRAMTYDGTRALDADEDELGAGAHDLSPVFHAAQEVITQLRLIDEQAR
jgi:hypothetical protein